MDISIGPVLRELRLKNDYRQQDVVAKLNELGLKTARQNVSRWELERNNPSLEQFIGLCKIYGIKDIYKAFAEHDFSELSHQLNRQGQQKLDEYRELLIASGRYSPEPLGSRVVQYRRRTAPLYDFGVSAGTGQFLDSDSYEMVEVPDDVPESATFGLHVSGDSMEPTLYDGQIIWVHQQPAVEDGDIGIFLVDGEAYVKEFKKSAREVSLVSHNSAYAPIRITDDVEIRTYGKVIYPVV